MSAEFRTNALNLNFVAFSNLHGSVVAVKIVSGRGKCYGFVTYKNPSSVIEAIREMDGQNIGGRVVRVNEVKSRGTGGKSNHDRESLRHNQRDMDWNNGRGRERENSYGRERHHYNSQEHDGVRERRRSHSRDRFQGRNRDQSRELGECDGRRIHGRNRDLKWDRNDGLEATEGREFDKVGDHGRRVDKSEDQHSMRLSRRWKRRNN